MKLLSKYTLVSLSVSLIIFVIGGIIYFKTISYLSDQQLDRDLTEEFAEKVGFIDQHQRFPKPFEFDTYEAKFQGIGQSSEATRSTDTIVSTNSGEKTIPCRAIIGTVRFHGTNYRMIITASTETTQSVLKLVSTITLALIILLFMTLLIVNRIVFERIWQPFYQLLRHLKDFSLTGEPKPITVNPTKIKEFVELNEAIVHMEERAKDEYQSLKFFTENASHEMMTPVALINSKLDNLIQDETLNSAQLEQLNDIYSASRRLSHLNQSLLLLVKIDNGLIHDVSELDLSKCIKQKVAQFEDVMLEKNIKINLNLLPKTIKASKYLIDILISNLLSNAIRHNYTGGETAIFLDESMLSIENTGNEQLLDTRRIFERFEKSPSSEGTGLGLTIARNICLTYGFKLEYQFTPPFHRFFVLF
ncbi:MAG TPA: HAMP domain-containing sensor histidine kinase [Mucilaginibacter sp.]